jgi:sigma-E factor negative regulatory protein RseB
MDIRSRPAVGTSGPGTDIASLRLITVVVLAGLVVSGIVVVSRHTSPFPAAVRASGQPTPTMRLLGQAARACHTVTYAGMEVLGARDEPGSAVSVVNVWHAPGGITLAKMVGTAPHLPGEAPRIVLPVSSLGGQALVGNLMLGMSPRLAALLSANYRVAAAGWGQVAGRQARVVTAKRRNGKLAAKFWLDRATTLPLRQQTFDGRGDVVSEATFTRLTVGHGAAAKPARAAPKQWVTASLPRLRAQGWPLPGQLPGHLMLLGARQDSTPEGPVIDLDYSDGLSLVSVFFQRGHLRSGLAGWSRVVVGGSPVYADTSNSQAFVWSAQGFVYTVVAAASPQTVAQVVATLPHGSPGLFERMRQGLRRLLSWFTP